MTASQSGPLGDSPERSYGGKLERYERFLEPELREIIAGLVNHSGLRILDAGCGVGLVSRWLAEATGAPGAVVGVDLSYEIVLYSSRSPSISDRVRTRATHRVAPTGVRKASP